MNKEQVSLFLKQQYGIAYPIPKLMFYGTSMKWFRIHSLPNAKRYASDNNEWDMLLRRQNIIISDILGNNAKFLLIIGDYFNPNAKELHPIHNTATFNSYIFNKLDTINMHEYDSDIYDEGLILTPWYVELVWNTNAFNDILKEIADGELQASFIGVDAVVGVEPYDGGINFYLNPILVNKYKNKYKNWLSSRADGL